MEPYNEHGNGHLIQAYHTNGNNLALGFNQTQPTQLQHLQHQHAVHHQPSSWNWSATPSVSANITPFPFQQQGSLFHEGNPLPMGDDSYGSNGIGGVKENHAMASNTIHQSSDVFASSFSDPSLVQFSHGVHPPQSTSSYGVYPYSAPSTDGASAHHHGGHAHNGNTTTHSIFGNHQHHHSGSSGNDFGVALSPQPSHSSMAIASDSDDILATPPHHSQHHAHHHGNGGMHANAMMTPSMGMANGMGMGAPSTAPMAAANPWSTPANGGTVMATFAREHLAASPLPSPDPMTAESDSPAISMRSLSRGAPLSSHVASTQALPTTMGLPPLALPPSVQRGMRFDRDPTMSVAGGAADFLSSPLLDRSDTFSLTDEPSSPASSSSSEGSNGNSTNSTCVCCHQSIDRNLMQQHVARCFVQRHMQHMRSCPASPRNPPMNGAIGAAMSPYQSPMPSPPHSHNHGSQASIGQGVLPPAGLSIMLPSRTSSSPSPRQSPRASPRSSPLSSPRSLAMSPPQAGNGNGVHIHNGTTAAGSRMSPPLSPCSSSCQVPNNEAPGATIYRLRSLLSRMDIHRRISLMESFNRLSHHQATITAASAGSAGSSSPVRGTSATMTAAPSAMSPKPSLEDEEALTLLFHTPPSGPRTPVLSPPPLGSPLGGPLSIPSSPLGKRHRVPQDMDHPMATAAKHRHYLPSLSL